MASSPSLNNLYNQPTYQEYWHHMAKSVFGAHGYSNKEKLESKIASIAAKLGSCSFNEISGPNRWTPMHVAVLAGNRSALQFFLCRGGRTDIPDANGETAIDLAKKGHPELIPYLRSYHEVSEERKVLCSQILEELCPKRGLGRFFYDGETDDFGIENRKVLFCCDIDPALVEKKTALEAAAETGIGVQNIHIGLRMHHLYADMERVGRYEGFDVEPTHHHYYPRDYFTRAAGGAIVASTSKDLAKIELAFERGGSYCCYFACNTSFQSTHELLKHGMIGGSIKDIARVHDCYFKRERNALNELHFPLEGGDKFLVTNRRGEKVLLLGEQHFPLIHSYCRLTKFFDHPSISLPRLPSLSDEVIRKTAEEMYALGLLEIGDGSAFLDRRKMVLLLENGLRTDRTDYRDLAIEMGLFNRFEMKPGDLLKCRPIVEKFLAQREVLKRLLGMSFGVKPENVIAIPNIGYHLDTVIAPGPDGQMFVYDPEVTLQVINGLLSKRGAFEFTRKDLVLLGQYKQTAEQFRRELGPLFKRATALLETAGIPVIRTPGIFFDISMSRRYPLTSNVHFMNPLTGYSARSGGYYYITTGTSVGDQLGPALMDVYAQFLERQIPGVHVHYVGRNPDDPKDFAQAMQLYNISGKNPLQAGIHCHSFPLETASHGKS